MNTFLYITLTVIPMAVMSCICLFGVILILFVILDKPIRMLIDSYKRSWREFFTELAVMLFVFVLFPVWFVASILYNSK